MKPKSENDRVKKIVLSVVLATLGGVAACGCMALLTHFEVINVETSQLFSTLVADGLLLLICWNVADKVGKGKLLASATIMSIYLLMLILGKTVFFSELSVMIDWRLLLPIVSAISGSLLASRKKERRK